MSFFEGSAQVGFAFDWQYPGALRGHANAHVIEQINQMECWCYAQFGPCFVYAGHTEGRWTYSQGRFWFRDQIDATAFKLRWV